MNKTIAFTLASGFLVAGATAKVSFSLDIEALTQGDGVTSISDKGLIVLVVDTEGDGFQLPSAGNLASGNDEVVATWDLDDYAFASADITLTTENGIAWGGNWAENDDLALFWFPTLSSSNKSPAADTAYGVFSDALGLTSGDSWKMPADGTLLHSLKLFTAAATKLVPESYDELPASVGAAAFSVINPPAASAPPTPSLGVAKNGTSNTLTWSTAAAPASGYIVQRKTPNGEWESVGVASAGDTSFQDDEGLKPGVEYEYRLYSVSALASAISNVPAIVAERSFLTNVSARSRVVAGNPRTQMFGGLIVEGDDATNDIVIQAVGKSLLGDGFIADPKMDLYEDGVLTASNDDWLDSAGALAIDDAMAIGNAIQLAADGTSKDSSDLVSAKVGSGYSFAVASKEGDTADLFLGIFDAKYGTPTEEDNRITNLAARGFLGDDAGSLFAGSFIVRGNVPKEVLVMAWGPYLSAKADTSLVGLTVVDPKISLFKGSDIVAENDNWETQTVSSASGISFETDVDRIKRVVDELGYAPLDAGSTDAVLLMTVDPGAYAFSYEGNGGTGIGFITIDEVEID